MNLFWFVLVNWSDMTFGALVPEADSGNWDTAFWDLEVLYERLFNLLVRIYGGPGRLVTQCPCSDDHIFSGSAGVDRGKGHLRAEVCRLGRNYADDHTQRGLVGEFRIRVILGDPVEILLLLKYDILHWVLSATGRGGLASKQNFFDVLFAHLSFLKLSDRSSLKNEIHWSGVY